MTHSNSNLLLEGQPEIRKRDNVRSGRRRDGLMKFAANVTSQHGEDGILNSIFGLLAPHYASLHHGREKVELWCVDVGAWDGQHWSNTYSLLVPSLSAKARNHENNHYGEAKETDVTEVDGEIASKSSIVPIVWHGILIEADADRFEDLSRLHEPLGNICLQQLIVPFQRKACGTNASTSTSGDTTNTARGTRSLSSIIAEVTTATSSTSSTSGKALPRSRFEKDSFGFLCIDVDGSDYWIWNDILRNSPDCQADVVCVEFNPTMPDDLIYIPTIDDHVRHGASLSALVELGQKHGYTLVETTLYNAFFVRDVLYRQYLQEEVPDTSIEALHEVTMGTTLYQLYDGTLKLWGCRKLLWHRIPMQEDQMQMLAPPQRVFPMAPSTSHDATPDKAPSAKRGIRSRTQGDEPSSNDQFVRDNAIDLSAYCQMQREVEPELVKQKREACAIALVDQLLRTGFCYVRKTGISGKLCGAALQATQALLTDADESVRRSCLAPDRARRGYSPMNTENFASLLGEVNCPNDLVRKFRMGPPSKKVGNSDHDEEAAKHDEEPRASPLLHPNIWPSPELWDKTVWLQSTLEEYYAAVSQVARAMLLAICHGLASKHADLHEYLLPLMQFAESEDDDQDTTILTCLEYRVTARHRKPVDQRHPLVAAHTDVGLLTLLLFDVGNCAVLQRRRLEADNETATEYIEKSEGEGWMDVHLPRLDHDEPVFVVNVADCLSDVSGRRLPSTIHRVAACPHGSIPRHCCALFLGLPPSTELKIPQSVELENHEVISLDFADRSPRCMSYEEWRKQRIDSAQSVLRSRPLFGS